MSWKSAFAYSAVFVVVSVGYRVWSEYAGPRFDEGLQKSEADMKKTLPMKIDGDTTLVDVKYERTKTTYWFVIDTAGATVDPHEVERRLCENSEASRTIREKGFSYEYHYANKTRAVADFIITKCP